MNFYVFKKFYIAKRARNERKRLELKGYLERRKELKKSIKEKSEYIPMIESAYKW